MLATAWPCHLDASFWADLGDLTLCSYKAPNAAICIPCHPWRMCCVFRSACFSATSVPCSRDQDFLGLPGVALSSVFWVWNLCRKPIGEQSRCAKRGGLTTVDAVVLILLPLDLLAISRRSCFPHEGGIPRASYMRSRTSACCTVSLMLRVQGRKLREGQKALPDLAIDS